ncbi:MAG: hydantoinase B/oxoprolinase family protein [Nitrospinota bacterium]
MKAEGLDPITLEVIRHALDSIADEMAYTIVRSSRSTMIKDCMDYSAAVCDAKGRLIAQGVNIPLMMCAIPDALEVLLRKYEGRIFEGDVFILNDPYDGGSHLPDIFLFKPVFFEGAMVAIMATCAHHADVGGVAAGSAASEATEVFQEGLRIPNLKLYQRGRPNETLMEVMRRNVRFPEILMGDIHAQLAACHLGEREYLRLMGRHGAGRLERYLEALLDHSERLTRQEIAGLPDGTYTFTDYLDEDGLDPDPIPITVAITISGDSVRADFTGSSPQVRGSLNCSFSFTKAAVYTAIKCVTRADIPDNSGFFRPIEVYAPPGSVVHAVFPAATFMRGLTGYRLNNVLFGALAQAAPERVIAADEGGTSIVLMDGYDEEGRRFLYMETISGAWGGRPDKDGIDCCSNVTGLQSNVPVEVLETEYPIRVVQYGFVPDSGGPGKYRGGLGLVREYRYEAEGGTLQMRADRVRFAP